MEAVTRLRNAFLRDMEANMADPEWHRQPEGLYAPQRYIMSLGGKRLRPVLSLMAAEALGAPYEVALPAAHAVERFHNFSLIHDDIMDDAPLRRGKATVHEQWSDNHAILSGDALLVMSYQALMSAPEQALPALLKSFNRTALEVCEGQQFDMDFEAMDDVTEGQYIQMIQYKTSVLLGCALEMGVHCANGSREIARALNQFGLLLGTAFQIHDDILDAFGDPEKVGKQVGGDILQEKKTILWIALNQRDPEALTQASSMEGDAKVEAVKAAYEQSGARAHAEALRHDYYGRAIQALAEAEKHGAHIGALRQMAEWLFDRES